MPSVDLSYNEVESYISQINLAGKIVEIVGGDGKTKPLFISHPSLKDKMYSEFEYKKVYDRAVSEGFLTVKETEELLREKGLYTDEDDKEIAKLRDKLDGQKKLLQMITRVPSRKKKTIDNIDKIEKQIEAILIKKEIGLEHSADKKASEAKYLYLTYKGVKHPNTLEFYWPTLEDFESEKDVVLRRECFVEVIKLNLGISVDIIRFLARNNVWRVRYVTSLKTGASLFGRPVSEYSVDQLSLDYWSNFYQSIYDMMPEDRPEDSVINDDIALDAYMESYMKEKSREASAARENKKSGDSKSAWDHGDVIVTKANEAFEEIEYSDTFESAHNKKDNSLKEYDKKSRDKRSSIRNVRRRLKENL